MRQRSFRGPLDNMKEARQSRAMRSPQLPGPAVIASMMLAAAIISVISITGPIPVRYDQLKDFQPSIAAGVALIAAGIAYFAAQTRVNFDRAVHEATEQRRQINLLRKLHYAARIFCSEVEEVRKKVYAPVGGSVKEIRPSTFDLTLPQEFNEAWDQVDILTTPALDALANARYNFNIVAKERAAMILTTTVWSYRWVSGPPAEIAVAVDAIRDLEKHLRELIRLLPLS
ncbi:hypothetical protein [Bradyrhizobium erythrophlei]|uniref:hypothetical protein n=1 Tax=Bradyrhizobium erythrophlei TaxID=1437360 RepID=UPI00156159BA|nr:hypothetical protein [Bradyrhizobium erythrophlei]